MYQDGVFAPDSKFRWMLGIAEDEAGNYNPTVTGSRASPATPGRPSLPGLSLLQALPLLAVPSMTRKRGLLLKPAPAAP